MPPRIAFRDAPGRITPGVAADRLSRLGFLAVADLPDRPGPGLLLVAIRDRPTFRHFDPEAVTYWITADGHGRRRTFPRDSSPPLAEAFSWGLIRIVDRLGATNEYLTFGGRVEADRVGDAVVVRFVSPAPIVRRGGHSQGVDEGAEAIGAWFGRLRLAVDLRRGFEAELAAAEPLARYAAFLRDAREQLRTTPAIRSVYQDLACLVRGEAVRLEAEHPDAWAAGDRLRPTRGGTDERAEPDGTGRRCDTRPRAEGRSAVVPAGRS
ncbi:MAG TPA: hypothetical protein VFJ71_01690 [Candidatus Limnocylindrales bacterium]|nr:hypothetical protein [Candidatus Limnocylindrales bacterium]